MATAISFTSESSDHYLKLFDGDVTIEEIVSSLKEAFDTEFAYLQVQNCVSSQHNEQEICHALVEAIDAAYDEED